MAHKKYPTSKGTLQYAELQNRLYFQVTGLANMDLANPFQKITQMKLKEAQTSFFIDLKECRGMDSTFMGVLIGIAIYDEGEKKTEVHILNANSHNKKLMQSLGLDQVVYVVPENTMLPKELHFMELTSSTTGDRIKLIHRAHQNLVDIDPRNAEQFGSFLELLKKELPPN
ncbi:MAG: STAS domain-containing protein [Planctomycetota bacterium]